MTQLWRSRRHAAVALLAGMTVALTAGCAVSGDLVAYELPATPAEYTLDVEIDGVTTVWNYTSQRPQEDKVLRPCLEAALGDPDAPPCQPEPLIFLRYQLGLDLDDTVPARRPHEIAVTSYYQPQPGPVPTVTGLTVEASFDGGTSWKPMRTWDEGASTFAAVIKPPARVRGGVALRVSAVDSEGNSVVQTIPEAYRLR